MGAGGVEVTPLALAIQARYVCDWDAHEIALEALILEQCRRLRISESMRAYWRETAWERTALGEDAERERAIVREGRR